MPLGIKNVSDLGELLAHVLNRMNVGLSFTFFF